MYLRDGKTDGGTQKPLMLLGIMSILMVLGTCTDRDSDAVSPPTGDSGDYLLTSTYDSIRSYPGGGGIFLVHMEPDTAFSGTIRLRRDCDVSLKATHSKTVLTASDNVVELLLSPSGSISTARYPITVVATHAKQEKRLDLLANVLDWQQDNFEPALEKRDQFREYTLGLSAAYTELFSTPSRMYATYPMTIIVEHYTMLTSQYECRFCYHVMVPPYDWSMMRIRKRLSISPDITLKRDTEGTVQRIPGEEYPTLYGY